MGAFCVLFLPYRGEHLLIVLPRDVKNLVDRMSSRSKHRFAGQRTSLKNLPVVLGYVHNVVDHSLRKFTQPSLTLAAIRRRSAMG